MIVTFSVPFVVPKARPRFAGHAYTSRRTVEAERKVRDAYKGACVRKFGRVVTAPAGTKVTMFVIAMKRAPKRRPKLVPKALWELGAYPFTQAPDYDNLLKLCSDALNGVAWADDAQITDAHVHKMDRRRFVTDVTAVTIIWEDQ